MASECDMERLKTGILIFPDVELLDFAGPFEVFSVVRLNPERRREEPSPFDVFTVAERPGPVRVWAGLEVLPQRTLEDCPPLDILVVPGGWGTRALVKEAGVVEWIRRQAKRAQVAASVCTGSFLLAEAGLLARGQATTHWASIERMRQTYPAIDVIDGPRYVRMGKVITSAGISAGIDMALRVVADVFGEGVATESARYMQYEGAWQSG
jgi:transcriptional regulator GlxA family with amidase domain